MRRVIVVLLALGGLWVAPSAVAQEPTVELAIEDFDTGPVTVRQGSNVSTVFNVRFTVDGMLCSASRTYQVDLSAEFVSAPPDGGVVGRSPFQILFDVPGGTYVEGPATAPYSETMPATLDVSATPGLASNGTASVKVLVAFDGGTQSGCATGMPLPPASAEATQSVTFVLAPPGTFATGTPDPNATTAPGDEAKGKGSPSASGAVAALAVLGLVWGLRRRLA